MKRSIIYLMFFSLLLLTTSCATTQPDRYNPQRGAAVGAGIGALMGQAMGGNIESTLLGAGIGTLVGAIAGNAVDQENQAERDAARTNKRIIYVDRHGRAVEAIPTQGDKRTKCRKITKRQWDKGQLISETVEEICEGEKTTRDY